MKIGLGIGLGYSKESGGGGGAVAPVNTIAPVISGTTTLGSTLTSTTGTWTGIPAPTFTFQWYRGATLISGATNNTYVTVLADSTASITCRVTGTNIAGSAVAISNALTMANYTPVNSVAPVISGTTTLGSTLTSTTGTWSNNPATYSYQWYRGASLIGGATSSTYVTVLADSTANITCVVTATNVAGSANATSNTLTMADYTPANTVAPAVSGTAVVGQVLTTTNGTWTNSPSSYSYQWKRGATNIGTNATTYTLVAADAGNTSNITCVVTATNTVGSANATSNTTAQILTVRTSAFLTASAISDATIRGGLNTFDIGLISNSLDTKMSAIYPLVGGTASTHKWNFMNAVDTNAAYRLTFGGTVTHNANGITGNGTNGYADTYFVPSTRWSAGNAHISTYDRTSTVGVGNYTIGSFSTSNATWISYRDTQWAYLGGLNNVAANGQLLMTQLRIATRTATNVFKGFRNAVQVGTTVTTNTTTYPTSNIWLLAAGGLTSYSDHNLAFSSIGLGLSDAEVTSFNTLVQNMQTTLGRNV
jgi:hypothetical protein